MRIQTYSLFVFYVVGPCGFVSIQFMTSEFRHFTRRVSLVYFFCKKINIDNKIDGYIREIYRWIVVCYWISHMVAVVNNDQLAECESKYASFDVIHNGFACKVDVLFAVFFSFFASIDNNKMASHKISTNETTKKESLIICIRVVITSPFGLFGRCHCLLLAIVIILCRERK